MKRTTISLPEDLAWVLAREARRRDASVSEVVRTALSEHFNLNGGKRHISFAGIGDSGLTDISERFEEYLAETWADDIANDRDP